MYIECRDFCVRNISSNDAEAYFEIYSNPQVAKYDDFAPITRADLVVDMARIALYNSQSAYRELAVVSLADNKMIGVITLDTKRKYCYIGYHFNPTYHGRGFAYRSVAALLESMSLNDRNKLRLLTHPDNISSISLAKKIGFVFVKQRFIKGVPESVYAFDVLEWEAKFLSFTNDKSQICGKRETALNVL
jgi:[ribosomal protein S5]-alanine N-acetyltransferase